MTLYLSTWIPHYNIAAACPKPPNDNVKITINLSEYFIQFNSIN